MKKYKSIESFHPGSARPAKPPAPAPGQRLTAEAAEVFTQTYKGAAKTNRAPKPAGGSRSRLKPAFKQGVKRPDRGEAGYGNQEPPSRRDDGARHEQYVRIRIRVSDDRLTVVDSHLVDGPLAQPTGFSGSNAYEVLLGDRVLHAAPLPDLGIQRSFVDPPGAKRQRGHYFTERQIYEFAVRVPAHEIGPETFGKITVRLYRLKENIQSGQTLVAPMHRQFERQVRLVGQLEGLPETVLPSAIEARGGRTPRIS